MDESDWKSVLQCIQLEDLSSVADLYMLDNNHEPVASLDWGDERRRLDENSNQKFISYFQGDEKGWTNTK